MNLTTNFTLDELIASQTASRKGINNEPDERQTQNLIELCREVLEPLRAKLAKPIHILSGFRCPALNKAVGGAKTSQHLEGMAVDLWVDGYTTRELFDFIRKNFVGYTQLLCEFPDSPGGGWIHISYDKNNIKNQDLIAEKVNGRTVYTSA